MSNRAASVRSRLLAKAQADGQDFSLVLTRFGLERLLYRLSVSPYKDHFLLKGALLFDMWFDQPLRPTRDIDLLGFGLAEEQQVLASFGAVCRLPCEDGIEFEAASIKVVDIRKQANYAGLRVTLVGWLDGARCPVQIDIGYGDAVTPAPEEADYPVMLADLPAPRLRTYPRYTVIAEKFEAIVSLGMANTRLKDYFDLWVLLQVDGLDAEVLRQAMLATFARRGTPWPGSSPVGLSDAFGVDPQKTRQWQAFVARNRLQAPALSEVLAVLREHLNV